MYSVVLLLLSCMLISTAVKADTDKDEGTPVSYDTNAENKPPVKSEIDKDDNSDTKLPVKTETEKDSGKENILSGKSDFEKNDDTEHKLTVKREINNTTNTSEAEETPHQEVASRHLSYSNARRVPGAVNGQKMVPIEPRKPSEMLLADKGYDWSKAQHATQHAAQQAQPSRQSSSNFQVPSFQTSQQRSNLGSPSGDTSYLSNQKPLSSPLLSSSSYSNPSSYSSPSAFGNNPYLSSSFSSPTNGLSSGDTGVNEGNNGVLVEGCKVGTRILGVGDKWSVEGICGLFICNERSFRVLHTKCPDVAYQEGSDCYIAAQEMNKAFPDCCPKLICSNTDKRPPVIIVPTTKSPYAFNYLNQ